MEKYQKHRMKERLKDYSFETCLFVFTALCAIVLMFIFVFILKQSFDVFKASGVGFFAKGGFSDQVSAAFNATEAEQSYDFGALGLIAVWSTFNYFGSTFFCYSYRCWNSHYYL